MTADQALIYEAAWRKVEIFFEWRHKVMTFSVTLVGAGIVAAGWLLNNGSDQVLVGTLLLFLAATLVVMWLLDRRVAIHMADAYEAGELVEQQIREHHPRWAESAGLLPLEALNRHRHRLDPEESATEADGGSGGGTPSQARQVRKSRKSRSAPTDRGSLTFILRMSYLIAALTLAVTGALIAMSTIQFGSGDETQKVELVAPTPTP